MSEREVKRCGKCYFDYYGFEMPVRMLRLYVKATKKGEFGRYKSWRTVGWICPNCLTVKLEVKEPLKRFSNVKTRG